MNLEHERVAFDKRVRYHIYDFVMREGLPPTITETSFALGCSTDEVRASFERLADGRILVLQKRNSEILMANPFSAVPTLFQVKAGDDSYYGNCIWDALGISAMLNRDSIIEASCGCCGTGMSLKVNKGLLENANGIAHFAIPAAHWWDDIVFN